MNIFLDYVQFLNLYLCAGQFNSGEQLFIYLFIIDEQAVVKQQKKY